jgi:hypothetical protein
MSYAKDLTGLIFGRITVLRRHPEKDKFGSLQWVCLCICGKETVVRTTSLKSGHTTSCGCYNREQVVKSVKTHGQACKTSEYWIWRCMKQRCYLESHLSYPNYGGRGIFVCDRWLNSFENFFEDMGPRPGPEYSLDRWPNNDGNYEPGNVRWGTDDQQRRNKRNNIWLEHNGKKMIIADWAKELGMKSADVRYAAKTNKFNTIFLK